MASGNFNQWTGIGNLGKAPESGFTQNGKQWTKFNIATTQGIGQRQKTLWMPCIAWEKLAEICNEYLTTGQKVFIQGSLEINEYTDKNNIKRFTYQVTVSSMQMLSSKNDNSKVNPPLTEEEMSFNEELEQHPF